MPIAWFLGHAERGPRTSQHLPKSMRNTKPYLSQSRPGNRMAKVYCVACVVVDLWSLKSVYPYKHKNRVKLRASKYLGMNAKGGK